MSGIPRLKFQINPPGFADWKRLHALLNDCFAYMEDTIDPPSSLARMSPDSLQQKAKTETLAIVRDGKNLVACAYFKTISDAIYLGKIAVLASHRKQGITRKIIALAEDHAKKQNRKYLELQTRIELVDNHHTFQRLDFVKTRDSSHEGYTRTTSITMRKMVGK